MEKQVNPALENIAGNLGALGYSPTDSLVLAYFLLNPKDVTAQQVERATWLRQPQVSLSITSLMDKKWIKRSSQTPVPIGRAITNYDLRCTPEQLCDRLRDAILTDMDVKMTTVNKLDMMIHGSGTVSNEAC